MPNPYRPSNGAEGSAFMERFCDRCRRDVEFRSGDGGSCLIAVATMIYPVSSPAYPPEWITDDAGPRCTAFEQVDAPIRDARQMEMGL